MFVERRGGLAEFPCMELQLVVLWNANDYNMCDVSLELQTETVTEQLNVI